MAERIVVPDLAGQPPHIVRLLGEMARAINELAGAKAEGQGVSREDFEALKSALNGMHVIDRIVNVASSSGGVQAHSFRHGLNRDEVIPVLRDTEDSGTFVNYTAPQDRNTWETRWHVAHTEANSNMTFYGVKKLEL